MKKHKAILAIFICICLLTPPCFQLSTIGKVHAEMDYALGEVLSSPDTHVSANVMDNAKCGELYAQLMSSTTPMEAQALISLPSDVYPESFSDILLADENAALGGHANLFIQDEQQDSGMEDEDDRPDFIGVAPLVDTLSGNSGSGEGNQISASRNDAVRLVKNATANNDGSYTITLEAWVNGMVAAASDPLDIVLVLTHSSENGCELRNSELRGTLKDFCDRIKEQSTDGTKNRIAIIGHDAGVTRYESAFQNMATRKGQRQIGEIISEFDLSEAVQLDVGLEMAKDVLEANPVKKSEDRKRVVIVLTDGVPCVDADWDSQSTEAANSALAIAKKIKKSGATVYSVGIFEGANGSTENLPKFNSDGENNATQAANRLMHLLSSNYPNAKSMSSKGKLNANARDGRSYYLSATNAKTFNGIFEGIGNAIIGATSLGRFARIKDIVSVYFTLPQQNAIRVYTADASENTDVNNNEGWEDPILHSDFEVSVDEEHRTIVVSGFNYSENKVTSPNPHPGTTDVYGKKLIVQFDLVPKPGFIGGNNVPVNDLGSGIYQNAGSLYATAILPETLVNVAIPKFTVNAVDKNVYLLGNLSYNQLKADATAIADVHNGMVDLLHIAEGEEWKVAFVSIRISIVDSEYDSLKSDTTYILTVTVEPNTSPTDPDLCNVGDIAVEQTYSDEKAINVFKPVLKFRDESGYYGQEHPIPVDSGCTHIYWEHGTTCFDGRFGGGTVNPSMIGDEPPVNVEYLFAGTPPIANGVDGKTYLVASHTFCIDARPKIGNTYIDQYTHFEHEGHQDCDQPTIDKHLASVPSPEAYYHVNTCSITISKALEFAEGIDESSTDPDQNFIFKVHYNGFGALPPADYNVAITGENSRTIVGLPVGTYTVTEDGNWSWRYEQTSIVPANGQVELTVSANSATVTVTNTLSNPNWLGDEAAATNVFNSNGTSEVYNLEVPMILPKKEGDR